MPDQFPAGWHLWEGQWWRQQPNGRWLPTDESPPTVPAPPAPVAPVEVPHSPAAGARPHSAPSHSDAPRVAAHHAHGQAHSDEVHSPQRGKERDAGRTADRQYSRVLALGLLVLIAMLVGVVAYCGVAVSSGGHALAPIIHHLGVPVSTVAK